MVFKANSQRFRNHQLRSEFTGQQIKAKGIIGVNNNFRDTFSVEIQFTVCRVIKYLLYPLCRVWGFLPSFFHPASLEPRAVGLFGRLIELA